MSKIVVTRVPADRPGTMLLVRFGVVIGISLLTLGGWRVLEIDREAQRAPCMAALRAHYPEIVGGDDGDEGQPGAMHVAGCVAPLCIPLSNHVFSAKRGFSACIGRRSRNLIRRLTAYVVIDYPTCCRQSGV